MNGKELKNFIRGVGLTTEEAAKKIGISRQTLSTYFGKAEIEPNVLKRIKYALQNVNTGGTPISTEEKKETVKNADTQIDFREKYILSLEARIAEKEKAFEILAEQSKALVKLLETKIDTVQANLNSAVAERIGIVLKVDRNFESAEKGFELMLSKFDTLVEVSNKKNLGVQKK